MTQENTSQVTPETTDTSGDHIARLQQANAHLVAASIESHKQVEQTQLTSEQRYRTLFESIDEGFCIIEKIGGEEGEPLDFRYVEVNPAVAVQSGFSDVLGKTLREVVPEEFEEWLRIYDTILKTGESIRLEREIVSIGRVLEVHAFRVVDDAHRRIGVSFRDITERKRTEDALRESEAFNRSIIQSSPDCIKVLDLEGNLLSMENGHSLMGIDDIQPFLNKSWIDFCETRDRLAGQAAVKKAAAGGHGKFVGFFRMFRGEPKWWDVSISPILDANGQPERLLAISRDVTEHKNVENSLRESEQRYRNLFNSMDEGFCIIEVIFDADKKPIDYRFLEVNPAFSKHTGMHDVTGKRMRAFAPDHEAYWFETYGNIALSGEPIRFVSEAKALGRWFEVDAFRVGEQSSPKVAVLFTNITERKVAEKALRESLWELRATESELRLAQAALSQEKATLAEHVLQLQQMNKHLILATIEAHTMAKEIEKGRADMAHLAQHDALTDLPNRILLNDRMTQAIALAHRHGKQFALMFLDLDRFKEINDSLGHAVGDQLLQSVAKRLEAAVRGSDTVCRLGGDEFVILLAEIEHVQDAALSAQNIFAVLTPTHRIDHFELQVSVSIGISIYPDDGLNIDALIRNADAAMYQAKEAGRNNYRFFRPHEPVSKR